MYQIALNEFKKEACLSDVPDFQNKDAARLFFEDALREGDRDKLRRYQDVLGARWFARTVGEEKLRQCLKHAKYLAGSCPEKYALILRALFNHIEMVNPLLKGEKYRKGLYEPLRKREERRLAKEKKDYLVEIRKAINTLKTLDPDLSKFDEAYLWELAQEKEFEPSQTLYQLRQMSEYGMIAAQPYKRENPKGDESIRLFIYAIYDLLNRNKSKLTDNAICFRLASLLTITMGKEYSRQAVQGILSRRPPPPPEILTSEK